MTFISKIYFWTLVERLALLHICIIVIHRRGLKKLTGSNIIDKV